MDDTNWEVRLKKDASPLIWLRLTSYVNPSWGEVMAQTPSASCWRWCFSKNEKGLEGFI